jgi:hypothetical protein
MTLAFTNRKFLYTQLIAIAKSKIENLINNYTSLVISNPILCEHIFKKIFENNFY